MSVVVKVTLDTPFDLSEAKRYREQEEQNLIGSGAPLTSDFEKLKERNVVVFDLREESHLYLNGRSISLCSEHNCANAGKSLQEIEQIEQEWKAKIPLGTTIVLNEVVKGEASDIIHQVKVEKIQTERELCEELGISYYRLPVTDHRVAADETIARFRSIYQTIWRRPIYFHCRGGKGRSTFFMAFVNILRNRGEKSLEKLVEEQKKLGGKDLYKVPEVGSKKEYKRAYALLRILLLLELYFTQLHSC